MNKIYCINVILINTTEEKQQARIYIETKIYFIEEIKQESLMSKKHKKVYMALNVLNNYLYISF